MTNEPGRDDLAPARGCLLGIVLAVPAWAAILLALREVLRRTGVIP